MSVQAAQYLVAPVDVAKIRSSKAYGLVSSLLTCSTLPPGTGGEWTYNGSWDRERFQALTLDIRRPKAGFFWAGCTFLCLIWAFFRLPETKGFTFAELDLLYENKVPTRKFKEARPDMTQHVPAIVVDGEKHS